MTEDRKTGNRNELRGIRGERMRRDKRGMMSAYLALQLLDCYKP